MLIVLLSTVSVTPQTILREVIGSAGSHQTNNDINLSWTIGEVIIETGITSSLFLTQGFHQPENPFKPIHITFSIPEGFSPNNDGINDFFVIKGLSLYPLNALDIFNRWGDKVFFAAPYLNNWDGTSNQGNSLGGKELPIGTYFYLFHTGNGSEVFKGTIYLNR